MKIVWHWDWNIPGGGVDKNEPEQNRNFLKLKSLNIQTPRFPHKDQQAQVKPLSDWASLRC